MEGAQLQWKTLCDTKVVSADGFCKDSCFVLLFLNYMVLNVKW
ncbi:hypothetical protein BpHYR1_004103 [Brachionus plicatilis]|uniref:Uncharacterized protein n=1 Tax=Brachionus plicatilis TaxID=10195 RepID=A0A3M7PCE8_BRAPC|nr:hypothetical protein BpHYR1_004103 [Brachionus plicatilis]